LQDSAIAFKDSVAAFINSVAALQDSAIAFIDSVAALQDSATAFKDCATQLADCGAAMAKPAERIVPSPAGISCKVLTRSLLASLECFLRLLFNDKV
jgi:hypothetical protein